MNDIAGKELKVGQVVATNLSGVWSLNLCTVIGFSPKKVRLGYFKGADYIKITKFPEQVAVVRD